MPQLEQCQGALSLWRLCTDGANVYSVSTEVFLRALGTAYASRLPEHGAGLADTGTTTPSLQGVRPRPHSVGNGEPALWGPDQEARALGGSVAGNGTLQC